MVKRAMTTVAILAGGVLAPLSAAGTSPPSEGTLDTGTPSSMRVNPVFQPVIRQLLASSPTFRAQVERIANAPYVRVSVEPAVGGVGGCCTLARTRFHRYSEGALIARVEIAFPLTATEYAELLGHEFEHILEQIDRVDVRALAREGSEASRIGDDTYETRRAARAGRATAHESLQVTDEPPDRIRQGLLWTLAALRHFVRRAK